MVLAVNLGGPELVLVIVIFTMSVIVPIWAIVDILKRPEWAWEAAGRNRFVWLIVMILGIFVCNVSFLTAIFYMLFVRTDVKRQQQVGRGPGFPGR